MVDIVDEALLREVAQRDYVLAMMRYARAQQALHPSLNTCIDCTESIPRERQRAVPGVRLCVDCQVRSEKRKFFYRNHETIL